MDKNQKILLAGVGILLIIAAIIGVLAFNKEKNKPEVKDNKFKEQYESLNGVANDDGYTYPTVRIDYKNPVVYTSEKEVLDILKKKSGVIYFGFATDPSSRNVVEPLISAIESTGVNKLYYLDILNLRDSLKIGDDGEIQVVKDSSEDHKKILKKLDIILDEYYLTNANGEKVDTGEKRIYSPLVVVIKDGKIVDHHTGVLESISSDNAYDELSKDQKEELFEIYKSMFSKISPSMCTEDSGC